MDPKGIKELRFEDYYDDGALNETETLGLQMQSIAAELRSLESFIGKMTYRAKYHKDKIKLEDVEFLHEDIKRLIRDFA